MHLIQAGHPVALMLYLNRYDQDERLLSTKHPSEDQEADFHLFLKRAHIRLTCHLYVRLFDNQF